MRILERLVTGAIVGVCFLAQATLVQAAADSGVYVEIRGDEAPESPVVERWRLYSASYALVIGNDNYSNGWPRLSNAVKDAKAVADELQRRGFEVELLTDVSGQQLRNKLRWFFAIKGSNPDARLFLWYAGHGYTSQGEGYLVPTDAPPPQAPEFLLSALHMRDLGGLARIAKSKHLLAVFDSCFAGTIFQSQRARPPAAITAAVKRPVRQFLTSGDADQQVSDDGTFRKLFLRAIRREEPADANRDGYLTGTELSLYLEDRVINLTQGAQTPKGGKLRDSNFDQGDFVFVLPKPPEKQVAAAPATGGTGEAAAPRVTDRLEPSRAHFEWLFWETIQDSERASDYEAYLRKYPSGTFAELARNRLLEIQATAQAEQAEKVEKARLAKVASRAEEARRTEEARLAEEAKRAEEASRAEEAKRAEEASRAEEAKRAEEARRTEEARRAEEVEQQAALVVPPKPEPWITSMDATYAAIKNANLRAGPSTQTAVVGHVARGTSVTVTGRVRGKKWYRVAHRSGSAFVYASLIAEIDLWELTLWKQATESGDPSDYRLYTDFFPQGLFSADARARANPGKPKSASTSQPVPGTSAAESATATRSATPKSSASSQTAAGGTQTAGGGTQTAGGGTQTAALPLDRFDGKWRGQGKNRVGAARKKCGSGPSIKLTIRGGSISGTLILIVPGFNSNTEVVPFSGTVDADGRLSARAREFRIDGTLPGPDRPGQGTWNLSGLACRGTFQLTKVKF